MDKQKKGDRNVIPSRHYKAPGSGRQLELDDALYLKRVTAENIERYKSAKENFERSQSNKDRLKMTGIITRIAEKAELDKRTVKRYFEQPEALRKMIEEITLKRKKDKIRAEDWAYFFDGMRLISTSMRDLKDYIGQYIEYLDSPELLTRNSDCKKTQLASVGTFYDKARECFDTSGLTRTTLQRRKDQLLQETVENNLREWPQGTIGVHTVAITWKLDHYEGSTKDTRERIKAYSEKGGRLGLMLMVERTIGKYKAKDFKIIEDGTTHEEMANAVKKFLNEIKAPTKVVRLVTEKIGDISVPTTMNKDILQGLLGDLAIVEEDVPTIGLKGSFSKNSKSDETFKVKGRFKSIDDLYNYLEKLMDKKNI